MAVVAALIPAVAQLPTAAVAAALPMVEAAEVLTVIVKLNVFEKGPPLAMGRAIFFVCPLCR
jgi:hypothetical protein